MRRILIFIMLFLLVGCSNQEQTDSDELWDTIVNREYSADNGWAGEGIYFYEEGNTKYCDYMVYGSGLPVIALYPTEVQFDEDGNILITLPNPLITDAKVGDTIEEQTITLYYSDNTFRWEDLVFEDKGFTGHDMYYEMLEE